MPARNKYIVCLITGALGSGKTTLLNRLLKCSEISGSIVLINEFGDIGLDHEIVREVREDVLLLSSGCLCCSLSGDLRDELVSLVESLDAGEIEISGPIIIETTGLADPVPILQLINTDEVLSHHLAVGHVVTVVDALQCHNHAIELSENERQIALASILVLAKTDLASAADQVAVTKLLDRLNPLSKRFEIAGPKVIKDIVAAILHGRADSGLPAELPTTSTGRAHEDINSFVFEYDGTIAHETFYEWVQLLIQSQGERLLRMKGMITFPNGPFYVHSTGPLFYPPDRVHDSANPGRNRLICIGHGLDRYGIERSFRMMCLGATIPPRELERRIRLTGDRVGLRESTFIQICTVLADVFPQESLSRTSSFLHWDVHNPWSIAARHFDAWTVLGICEDPQLLTQIGTFLGPDINLVGSEVITGKTSWLARSQGQKIADDARYLPVDPERAVACRIQIHGPDDHEPGTIHKLSADWACPGPEGDWACLTLYYADAGVLFDRSDDHPANQCRKRERPLANSAAMPIWLVSGNDLSGNNYATGFDRPRPEWLQEPVSEPGPGSIRPNKDHLISGN